MCEFRVQIGYYSLLSERPLIWLTLDFPLLYVMNALLGVTGNIAAHVISDTIAALIAVGLTFRQYHILKCSLKSGTV